MQKKIHDKQGNGKVQQGIHRIANEKRKGNKIVIDCKKNVHCQSATIAGLRRLIDTTWRRFLIFRVK